MTTTHNHEPWCCCTPTDAHTSLRCPVCPEHGELAQLSEPQCPICHELPGRPHTEYCRFTGIVSILSSPDGPRIELNRTTLAAGQITTPHTQITSHPPRTTPDCPMDCAHDHTETVTYRTPGYDGPEGTEWPRHTPSTEHVWGQDTHYPPQSASHPISECTPDHCPPLPDDHPW